MRGPLYFIILLFIAGCSVSGGRNMQSLDEAEKMMTENPKAAFNRLSEMDITSFSDSGMMARWALLYSKAMLANEFAPPRDTIINIAIDYYAHHDQAAELNKAEAIRKQLDSGKKSDALMAALYAQKEKEFLLFKERARHGQYLFAGLIILLLAGGIIVWQRQRLKIITLRNEALIAEASSLGMELSLKQGVMGDVLKRRFSDIDELCQTYYETAGKQNEMKSLAAKVASQIDAIRHDAGFFAEMEKDVNDCRNHLAEKICPLLKPEEYRLFIYLACGLSNRTIALLFDENMPVVYKRKSRLKTKISTAEMAEKEALLLVF